MEEATASRDLQRYCPVPDRGRPAEFYFLGFKTVAELGARELAALVGIENLRPAKEADGLLQSF